MICILFLIFYDEIYQNLSGVDKTISQYFNIIKQENIAALKFGIHKLGHNTTTTFIVITSV